MKTSPRAPVLFAVNHEPPLASSLANALRARRVRHGDSKAGGSRLRPSRKGHLVSTVKNNFDALMLVQKEIQSGAVTDVEKGMLAKAFGLPAEFGRATKEELERAKKHTVKPVLAEYTSCE